MLTFVVLGGASLSLMMSQFAIFKKVEDKQLKEEELLVQKAWKQLLEKGVTCAENPSQLSSLTNLATGIDKDLEVNKYNGDIFVCRFKKEEKDVQLLGENGGHVLRMP